MHRRWILLLFPLLAGGSTGPTRAEDRLYQGERQGTLLFTNVPSRGDLRPRSGPSKRFLASLPGRSRYAGLVREASVETGLSEDLLFAVISVESGFRPTAVSPKGALGLMQLMPETARSLGVSDPFDPRQNILGGARHLRSLLLQFEGDLSLALAAYNAGEAPVRARQDVPPYPETRLYVRKVLERFRGPGQAPEPISAADPPPARSHPLYYYLDEDGTPHFTDVPGRDRGSPR